TLLESVEREAELVEPLALHQPVHLWTLRRLHVELALDPPAVIVLAHLEGCGDEVVWVIESVAKQSRQGVSGLLPLGNRVRERALGNNIAICVRSASEGRRIDEELALIESVIGASLEADASILDLHDQLPQ